MMVTDRPAGPCGLCRNFDTNVTAVAFGEPGLCRHHKVHKFALEGCPDAFESIVPYRRVDTCQSPESQRDESTP